MSRKGPYASSHYLPQGYEYDLESAQPDNEKHQQDMDGVASGVTLVAAGIQLSKATKRCFDDYRDAPRQMLRLQQQDQQIQSNLKVLDQLPQSQKEFITPAQASLKDVQASLRTTLHPGRKRDRLEWALTQKRKSESALTQSQQIQSSLSVPMLSSLRQEIEELKLDAADRQELLKYVRQSHRNSHTYRHAKQYVRKRIASQIYPWGWLAKCLGIKSSVIISKARNRRTHIFARWPLYLPFGLSQVVTGNLLVQDLVPLLPRVVLTPQNVISSESKIIKACESGDILEIQKLIRDKEFHPNDRTPDGLTVFRFAIRTGDPEVVRLLLEHGANPNLPFGQFETSPLNNAFLIGNVAIIRLLLDAGAELEYQNSRTWTSVSFLWDPTRPAHTTTTEIIEICMSQGFSAWDDTDTRGWSPVHRAAAYGRGEDIRNLELKGANLHSYTTDFLWGPMTCAVWHSNESTFDAFMDLFEIEEVVEISDSRGWTLLHMAAKNGCEHILRRLLLIGASREALTIGTQYWVTDALDWKSLTVETIVREYGHQEVWDKVVKEVNDETGGRG